MSMMRTVFGENRGDFGISAKPCPRRFVLSTAELGPGDGYDPP